MRVSLCLFGALLTGNPFCSLQSAIQQVLATHPCSVFHPRLNFFICGHKFSPKSSDHIPRRLRI